MYFRLKGYLWDKCIRGFCSSAIVSTRDVRWYSGFRWHGFRLLPFESITPFGSIQTQALSKPAVQRCKSPHENWHFQILQFDFDNPPTLFWSVRFGSNIIAKRSCKIFSYIYIFTIYACGSLFICFIACLSSVFKGGSAHEPQIDIMQSVFVKVFFFSRSYIQILAFI